MENLRAAITVYITNYNYGKYIDQAIKSVLSQTFKDFELIIIDDGSKDNSKKIIDKYKTNKKIRIIYQKNRGLNISNNIALKL
jgi:glycosyltransferase involved in cell wall biosynthesis